MKQGTVYLHLDFRFRNGDMADKFFIILNTLLKDEYFIPIITTSKQKWRPNEEGCHNVNNVYVLRENYDFFPKRTWVCELRPHAQRKPRVPGADGIRP